MNAPASLRRVLKFRTIVSTSAGLAYQGCHSFLQLECLSSPRSMFTSLCHACGLLRQRVGPRRGADAQDGKLQTRR